MSTIKWKQKMKDLITTASRGQESSLRELEGEARWRGNEKGFTLIELLTVIAMIAILSSVAIPSFNVWLYKYRADSEASRLYFNLMAAKQRAIRNNSTMIVTFSTTNDNYIIHEDLNDDGNIDLGETVDTIPLENEMVFGILPGVLGVWGTAVSNPVALNGGSTIKFLSQGRADRSGAIYMVPGSDLLSGFKGNQRAVKVVQATGNVEVVKYSAGATPGPWS